MRVDRPSRNRDNRDVVDIWSESKVAGLTLIELIISISIFVFLTLIMLFGFRGAGQANNLRQSGTEIVSALRRVQGMATSGGYALVCKDGSVPPSPCQPATVVADCGSATIVCGEAPTGGFGLKLTGAMPATQYEFFADLNHGASPSSVGTYSATEDALVPGTVIKMIDGIRIVSMKRGPAPVTGASPNVSEVVFSAPRGTVVGAPNEPIVLCLEHPKLGSTTLRRLTIVPSTGQMNEEGVRTCP